MNPLQQFGAVLMTAGLASAIHYMFIFDVSAARAQGSPSTPLGSAPQTELREMMERTANLDLMNQRQTNATVSGLFAVVGAILLTNPISLSATRRPMPEAGRARKVTGGFECPSCGLISPATAQRCDCGYKFT